MLGKKLALPALVAALLVPFAAPAGTVGGPVARLRMEARYDQNLIEGNGDAAGLIQPLFGWRLRNPTTEIEASYAVDLHGYAEDFTERGGANHRIRGSEEFRLDRRTVLQLRQGFERVYDPTALSRPGVVRAAGSSLYGDVRAELQYRVAPRWNAGLGYRYEIATLEAENAADGMVHAPGGWLLWNWTQRDLAGISYRAQYFVTPGVGADASSHEPALAWVRILGPATRLEVEAGPAFFEVEGERAVVPRGRISLAHRRPRLDLGAGYERALVGSTGFAGALWSDALAANAIWRLSEPLRFTVATGLFRNGRAPDDRSFVQGFAGEAAVEYDFARDFGVEVAWRRVAQLNLVGSEAVDLSRNIFAVGLTWQLQGRRLSR